MKSPLAGPRRRRTGPPVATALPPALEGLPQALAQLDARGVVVAANAAFDALFPGGPVPGAAFEAVLTRWLGATAADGLPHWRAWWARPSVAPPLQLDGPTGQRLRLSRSRTGLLWIETIEVAPPEPTLATTVRELEAQVQDGSRALEQARRSAERARHSKLRFFAAASHDLLQPLNAARIYAAALVDIPGLDPVAVDVGRRIDLALRHAEDIVDTLVDVARFDASGVRAQVEALDLDRLLEPLLDQYGAVARARGLRLRWHARGLVVRSDPRLLRRVLQNLIGNALRYTARGGVLVGARRRGAQVRIEVWDTGPGIAAPQQAEVFEEFRRLELPSPWGERGLGLGLWICRRIAALLDHRLDLRSTPGRGSVFAIEVPLAEAPVAPAPAAIRATGPLPCAGEPPLALVVDASAEVRAALVTLLAGWGLEVLADADPVRALATLGGRLPRLVIADEDVVGGWSLLESWPVHAGLPQRVYCATKPSEARRREAQEGGIVLLGKPLKPARLRAIVEDTVRLGPPAASPLSGRPMPA